MAGEPVQMATPEFRASHASTAATDIECSEAKSLTEGRAEPICHHCAWCMGLSAFTKSCY
jgi:hypothetical protein